ncbi:MAG: trigger factor [Actinobacteria bacterium]|uniref:Trigger factor n=1 Tax=Candidatus Fonsibacter lacus TaxID=2576439 RepID=A0A965GDX0_9PROT|nr:trigger factor [Candidatus Fonsibacter lacus]
MGPGDRRFESSRPDQQCDDAKLLPEPTRSPLVKSAVENLSPTRVRLTIDAPFSDLEPHFAKAYKEIASKVSIPGFRKGKIPAALIDQRVGRAAVLDEAINIALPQLYVSAAQEHDVRVLGRPEVDIKELVDNEKLSFTVNEAEIDEQVESLRIRFGTLTTVEKKAENGDFVSLNLEARVNGEVVEGGTANNISYEVGSDKMLPGLDEALHGMSANETKVFQTELFGGEPGSGGEIGDVSVTLNAVKKRELPPLDDSFAALASEFETLAELRADFKTRLERVKSLEQGAQARDLLVEQLLEKVEIPIPESYVLAEIEEHLKGEGREADDTHRAEVDSDLRKSLKNNFLLDAIVDQEKVEVTEEELSEFIVRTSMRYGMPPEQFANEVAKAGQLSSLVADVARSKALAVVLGRAKIVDKKGKSVDIEALRPQLKQ